MSCVQDVSVLSPGVPAVGKPGSPALQGIGGKGVTEYITGERAAGGGTKGGNESGEGIPGGGSPDPNDDITRLGTKGVRGVSANNQ